MSMKDDLPGWSKCLSGIIGSYQASDPAIVSDDPDPVEAFPLADLHELIERAFRA